MDELTYWKIDECAGYFDRLNIRGWCHVPGEKIERVDVCFADGEIVRRLDSFGRPSPDVDEYCGPGAASVRFDESVPLPPELLGSPFSVRCWLADDRCFVGRDALTNAAWGDAYFQSWETFLEMLGQFPAGAVLEIGSRARSRITRRHRIPERFQYIGFDVHPGPNVDIVGDAHEMSRVLGGRNFVAAFSTSVFEHLAMPWKVALELNHVLAVGGIVYTASCQTFPMHDEPWDFWRFSKHSWRTLFNAATGFELVDAMVGERARVHACRTSPVTRELHLSPAWLGSACIARKVSDTRLVWPVPLPVVTDAIYPEGELETAPTTDRT